MVYNVIQRNIIDCNYLGIRIYHEIRKKTDELTTKAKYAKLILFQNQQLCKTLKTIIHINVNICIRILWDQSDIMLFEIYHYKAILSYIFIIIYLILKKKKNYRLTITK